MAPPAKPMPPEGVMLPIILGVAGVSALIFVFLVKALSGDPTSKTPGGLPWLLLGFGVAGIAIAVFERKPKIDFKASVKANAMVVLFGPMGARIAYALIGGCFLGGGIATFLH